MHLHLVHHRSRWAPMLGRKAAVQALEHQPFGEVYLGAILPRQLGGHDKRSENCFIMTNRVLSAYQPIGFLFSPTFFFAFVQ